MQFNIKHHLFLAEQRQQSISFFCLNANNNNAIEQMQLWQLKGIQMSKTIFLAEQRWQSIFLSFFHPENIIDANEQVQEYLSERQLKKLNIKQNLFWQKNGGSIFHSFTQMLTI